MATGAPCTRSVTSIRRQVRRQVRRGFPAGGASPALWGPCHALLCPSAKYTIGGAHAACRRSCPIFGIVIPGGPCRTWSLFSHCTGSRRTAREIGFVTHRSSAGGTPRRRPGRRSSRMASATRVSSLASGAPRHSGPRPEPQMPAFGPSDSSVSGAQSRWFPVGSSQNEAHCVAAPDDLPCRYVFRGKRGSTLYGAVISDQPSMAGPVGRLPDLRQRAHAGAAPARSSR